MSTTNGKQRPVDHRGRAQSYDADDDVAPASAATADPAAAGDEVAATAPSATPAPSTGNAAGTAATAAAAPEAGDERGVRRLRTGRVIVAAGAAAAVGLLALAYGLSPSDRAARKPTAVEIDLRRRTGDVGSPGGLSLPTDISYSTATRLPDAPPTTADGPTSTAAATRPADPKPATPDPEAGRALAALRERQRAMEAEIAAYKQRLGQQLDDDRRQLEDDRKRAEASRDAPISFKLDAAPVAQSAAPTTAATERRPVAGRSASTTDATIDGPLNPLVVAPSGDAAINPNEVQPNGTRSNLQTEKIAFLRSAEDGLNTYLRTGPTGPVAPQFELAAGTVIPGFTVTGINTDLPGKVVGRVSADVFDTATGRHVLVPQGSTVVGDYSSLVSNGQNRVLIAWEMVTFPDGRSLDLQRQPGTDAAGYSGLKDAVDYHYPQLAGAAALSVGVSVAGRAAEGDQPGALSDQSVADDLRRSLAGGTVDATGRIVNKIIDRQLDVQPTITVRPGWEFRVLLTRNLILEPYSDSRTDGGSRN